ncbi:MAG TPA: hypothetical protein PLQ13_10560 [Candidatus Krumholzibacteria bacterium]|nr:hypothetical protein [Candidatus Krumholzibacteria bacterium]
MKFSTALSLIPGLLMLVGGSVAAAQDQPAASAADSVKTPAPAEAAPVQLEYDDYKVKGYTLSVFGGNFSGATYLDLPMVGDRTVVEQTFTDELGPADVLGYDGHPLPQARQFFAGTTLRVYDAAQKEIKSGPAYGGRIGIYISDSFHLDLQGTYASGKAVTTMVKVDQFDASKNVRVQVDEDDGFAVYKGGLGLMYDAYPATIFGVVPRLGFGLGGIINRYSILPDKTSLYLEGSLGLAYGLGDRLKVIAQADVTNFAFDVDELGHSNMVNYATLSLGVSWFIDVLPDDVRAAHRARSGH